MTVTGETGSLPLVYLNGPAQSSSVRLVSPLVLEMLLTTKAKRQQVLADAGLRQGIVKAVAKTAGVAEKWVEVCKVDEAGGPKSSGAHSRVLIRVQVACRQH